MRSNPETMTRLTFDFVCVQSGVRIHHGGAGNSEGRYLPRW
jgi:hypothetical protein